MKNGRWFLQTYSRFLFLFSLAGLWACAGTESSESDPSAPSDCTAAGFTAGTQSQAELTYTYWHIITPNDDGTRKMIVESYLGGQFNGPTTTGTYDIGGTNYGNCSLCLLMFAGCTNGANCSTTYYADVGTVSITELTPGLNGTVALNLSGAVFTEVTIDSESFQSTPVANAKTWCVDDTNFSGTFLNSDAPDTFEPALAQKPELSVLDAVGDEDTAIEIYFDASLMDTDGAETLTVKVCGLPNSSSASLDGFCRAHHDAAGNLSIGENDWWLACRLPLTGGGVSGVHYQAITPWNGDGSCVTLNTEQLASLERIEAVENCESCATAKFEPVCASLEDGSSRSFRNLCEATQCASIAEDALSHGSCGVTLSISPKINWNSPEDFYLNVYAIAEENNGHIASVVEEVDFEVRPIED